jgi:two-component system, chemotaxis family, protein-glutamate methylesterase/glutaminase
MAPIRILVADSSAVARREISQMLREDPELDVVAIAPTGRIALETADKVHPDVVVLDLVMPDMDGLEVVKELRQRAPRQPVLIFSAATESTGSLTLDALVQGASDYITKPSSGGIPFLEKAREQLISKIKALHARARPETRAFVSSRPTLQLAAPLVRQARIGAVVIGASTGGPNMLAEVLSAFPGDFPVPVFITQHMPPVFTRLFAERLDALSQLQVREALAGEQARAGQVWVAPGDFHLALLREGALVKLVTHQGPPENRCRPAVDVLFRAAASVYGAGVLAVVMTGMGQDGLKGCQAVSQAGGQIVVQAPATCIVGSMPQAVLQAGLAHQVIPLKDLGAEIVRRVLRTHAAEQPMTTS